MKKILITIALMTASISFAQVAPEASLKTLMKDMSAKLRTIATQSTDPAKNAASAQLALDLVQTVTQAKTLFPASATDKVKQDQYLQMMDQVIVSSGELAQAFQSNDNTKAAAILSQLSQDKKEGHTAFKN